MMQRGVFMSWGWGAVMLTLALGGCRQADETRNPQTSLEGIHFSVDTQDIWEQLRSHKTVNKVVSSPKSRYQTTLRLEDPKVQSQDVYLHVFEEDRIVMSDLLDKPKDPMTDSTEGTSLRATTITRDNIYASIGVFASTYPAGQNWNEHLKPNFMYNVEVFKGRNYKTDYYWPGREEKISFFAYAPYNGRGLTFSAQTEAGSPKLTFDVPNSVTDQYDLLVASNKNVLGDKRTVEVLRFEHALTKVHFTTDGNILPGSIKSIRIKGVNSRGIYTIGGVWSGQTAPKDFSYTANVVVNKGVKTNLNPNEYAFMMLPQTLPQGARIEVDYQVNGYTFTNSSNNIRTLSASIENQVWEKGKTVSYRISLSSIVEDYEFRLREEETTFDYEGNPVSGQEFLSNGNKILHIESTRALYNTAGGNKNLTSNTHNQPWTVEYSTDQGGNWATTLPSGWLSVFEANQGGTSNISVKMSKSTPISLDKLLSERTPLTEERDLSMGNPGTTGMTTANCYLVNRAGNYRFPLIYGNGYKNGQANPRAYDGLMFVDHNGLPLNHLNNKPEKQPLLAWTRGSHFVEKSMTMRWRDMTKENILVWESTPGLISSASIDKRGDYGYIKFSVNQSTIKQGNAVLCLMGEDYPSGNRKFILWSWHIWVTPLRLDDTEQVGDTRMMRIPLGWVEKQDGYYKARELWLRFTQTGSNRQLIAKLKQQKRDVYYGGEGSTAVTYQWGRKDPMMPQIVKPSEEGIGIGRSIQNPKFFYRRHPNWANRSKELWNNNGVKTIYDPSPVGFKVPTLEVFRNNKDTKKEWFQRFNNDGWWNVEDASYVPSLVTDKWCSNSIVGEKKHYFKWDKGQATPYGGGEDKLYGAIACMVHSVVE